MKYCVALLSLCLFTGCYRPFEPVQLEVIQANEDGFLIPLKGDNKKQASTNGIEMLEESLVNVKQVQIPQQWVPVGYEWMGPNGNWKPAATLIKVDRSPVTREWTADPNSGTSNKNEAIWVMTSDQVEFSTGWVCTARIKDRNDSVKFLFNYPNGSIASVLDNEVRAYVQTSFAIEVTDQPMSKLRTDATPHIEKVVNSTKEFFAERGLDITNLGISGGFVYKDTKIQETLVELFNAQQAEAIAQAKAAAVEKEATGLANAAKTKATGEAEAIKSIADAKAYEIEKAQQNLETYLDLKRLEVQKQYIEEWDGAQPQFYIGTQILNDLLSLQK